MATELVPPDEYATLRKALKERIQGAQTRVALAVNRELVLLYWSIGQEVQALRDREGWGSKVLDRLAADVTVAFPGVAGFARRYLGFMRAFAAAYPDEAYVQQDVANMPWGLKVWLLDIA